MPQMVLLLLRKAPDFICSHRIKHVHNFYFILVMSKGLGMCDRSNSLVCTVIWELKLSD